MDDFGGDLWGDDDIDEALLIEASQQVEAETVKARKSSILKNGNETVKIDEADLAILIQDVNEDNRKETDIKQHDDELPKHDRFMQTQTIFQGLDAPLYKGVPKARPTNKFHNSFNDTNFSKPSVPQKQQPKYPPRSNSTLKFDVNLKSSLNGCYSQDETLSQTSISSNYSNKDIENMVAELQKLKTENKELTLNKYSKNGEISVLRDEVKKYEVKLDNERQERHKLCDKKSLEVAQVDAKAKLKFEAMKSEKDFINRELDVVKEVLRKKEKKLKDIFDEDRDSPLTSLKGNSPNFSSPDLKRKRLDIKIKAEHGVVPQSIDRSLCEERKRKKSDSEGHVATMKECGVQTVGGETRSFILKKNNLCKSESINTVIELVRKHYGNSDVIGLQTRSSLTCSFNSIIDIYTFLVSKIKDLATDCHSVNKVKQLFNFLALVVKHASLDYTQFKEILSEIKAVPRIFIRKAKHITESINSIREDNNKNTEPKAGQSPCSKEFFDNYINFLAETLNFLEVTYESTSCYLCTGHKDNPCYIYVLSLSIQQLLTWRRKRNKESKEIEQEYLLILSKPLFSWLGANYKLICKQGMSLPWLMMPRNQQDNRNDDSKDSVRARHNVTANMQSDQSFISAEGIKECKDCRKDLVDTLILLLYEYVDGCTESHIEGVTNENFFIGSSSAVYLHKIWSADPQKFATIVAHNPRTQRQFLSAIAQMQRLTAPSQYILTKVLEELSVEEI